MKDIFITLCFGILMIPVVIIAAILIIIGILLLPFYLFYRIIAKKVFKKTFKDDCFSFKWSYETNGKEKTNKCHVKA